MAVRVRPHLRKGTLVVVGKRKAPGRGTRVYNGRYKRRGRRRYRR